MRATLVIRHGMNFVNDNGFHITQNGPALFRREQNVKRLRRGNQNVRRTLQHRSALRRERISGADSGANLRHQQPTFTSHLENFTQWHFEVLLNVVAECLERRNVQNFGAVLQLASQSLAYQTVNAGEKSRESLS